MTPWRMTPRRSNSAGPNSERSPATRWRARGQHWRSSNVNALAIGAHDPRSRLQRRSQVEASGPSCYVTARGRPTERLSRPAMRAGCGERRCARGRPGGGCGVPPPAAKATQVKHILGSAAHAARAFELFAGDDPAVRTRPDRAVPDSCASRRSGSPGALPECTAWWWTCRELIRILDASLRRPATDR